MQQGLQQGLQHGHDEGLQQGVRQEKLDNARKMKELGAHADFIAQVPGLETEHIEQLLLTLRVSESMFVGGD